MKKNSRKKSPKEAYRDLLQKIRELFLLEKSARVLEWDLRTYMPPQGMELRAEKLAYIAKLRHEMLINPELGERLSLLERSPLVKDPHPIVAANIRELSRLHERATKIPQNLVREITMAASHGEAIWREARQKSDFSLFKPFLEKILKLRKQEARALGHKNAYDAFLDEFEPGESEENVGRLIAELSAELVPFFGKIASKKKVDTSVLHRNYPVELQREFGILAAKTIGFDFNAGRLDVTSHPFCSGFGPGDCRITTRYNPHFFNEGFFGILHEAGHGIYEQGLDAKHFGTPAGDPCSFAIHESQSRTWENLVGRSRAFWEYFYPKAQKYFPQALDGVTLGGFYSAINAVEPSFIRVEADEVSYNLHIVLRFNIEQKLANGDLKVGDLPGAWNEGFKKLFGITPPNDAQGCLQDIHWAEGLFGYFPTYLLGNLYAAQFFDAARQKLPALEADFERGNFHPLKKWLHDYIHSMGLRYRAPELCQKVTGHTLSHKPFMAYLRSKFEA